MKLKLNVLIAMMGIAMPFAGMADVQPSALFTDNMVIQRETEAPVWGTAETGEKVTVEFAGQTKTAMPDETGKWMVKLDPMPASIFTTEAEVPAEVGAVAPVKAPPSRKKSLSGPPLKKNDRIIFLGDSITQLGVKEDGYVTLTSRAITKAYPDLGIEVIGAGRSGHKVPDCQKRLDRDVLQKKPTVVVIYIGINDVWHWSLRKRGGKGFRTGTTPEQFESGLKDMIAKINGIAARVILCTPTVIGEKPDGTNPEDKRLDAYADISRKVARETGAQLLDLRTAFIDYLKEHNPNNAEKGVLTSDRVHMNAKGNQLLFTLVSDALSVSSLLPKT